MPPRSRITRKQKKKTVTTIVRQRRTKRSQRPQRPPKQPRSRVFREKGLLALGGSSRPLGRDTARSSIRAGTKRQGEFIRFAGTELIGSVVVPTGGDVANCLLYHRFNNVVIPDTRIGTNAPLWQRWYPHKWRYRFIPSVPTGTQAGTYVFGQVADPVQVLTSGASGLAQQIRVTPGSSMKQYWQPSECDLSPMRDYTSLWTNDPTTGAAEASDRLDLAGQVALVTVTPGNLTAGYPLGAIELEYDIEFFVPKLSSTTLSKKTTTKIPVAEAKGYGIAPSGIANASPLQGVVKLLQDVKLPQLSEAVDGLLKNYEEFKNLSPPTADSLTATAPTSSGFPPGKYKFTWALYTDQPPALTTEVEDAKYTPSVNASYTFVETTSGAVDGVYSRGTSYYASSVYLDDNSTGQMPSLCSVTGAEMDYPPDPVLNPVGFLYGNCVDPLGETWGWGEGYSIEFAALSDTHGCYADLIIGLQLDYPSDAVIFVTLEIAGDDQVVVYDPATRTGKIVAKQEKRVAMCETKDEAKVRPRSVPAPKYFNKNAKLQTTVEVKTKEETHVKLSSLEDDEVDVISPPRFGTPVRVPGSSDYTPKSTPSTQLLALERGLPPYKKK